jgi:hypothetical protein
LIWDNIMPPWWTNNTLTILITRFYSPVLSTFGCL